MNKLAGIDVSRETMERLEIFQALTLKWTVKINLIAKSTIPDIWDRHIIDSVQLYQHAPDFAHWVDLGSGGGFPGIVMAIIAKEKNTSAQFAFIESDGRKSTFLRTAVRDLGLNAYVRTQRIDEAEAEDADVVSARALGSVSELLPLAARHLKPTGTALFMKGRRHAEELHAVSTDWAFDLEQYPSITDPSSRILSLKRISRAA